MPLSTLIALQLIPRPILHSWDHNCILSIRSIETLIDCHGSSIHQFSLSQSPESFYDKRAVGFRNLEKFSHVFIGDLKNQNYRSSVMPWLLCDVVCSMHSLRQLKIGREVKASPPPVHHSDQVQMYGILHDQLADSGAENCSSPMFELHTLHLIGLELLEPLSESPLIFTRVEVLQELLLESCGGVPKLLTSLASLRCLMLKTFSLRCEDDSPELRTGLKTFLESFSGLCTSPYFSIMQKPP